ncbi:unnamed protein product, partial [Amoebophrya sp. A25]
RGLSYPLPSQRHRCGEDGKLLISVRFSPCFLLLYNRPNRVVLFLCP